ncbi:MAG TPA: endolytic transglycosylase MltG [Candidatus Kapabacteria bacterium]|nr:endolytic transglycosylase MltG [Candidatus Kapabacteria bacterium]
MKKLSAIVALAAVIGLAVVLASLFWKNPANGTGEVVIFVPKGASLSSVTDSLAKHDLIRSKLLFKLAARFEGASSALQPGNYRMNYGLSNIDILTRLLGTEFAIIFEATFPEGSTIRKVASIAKEKLGLDSAMIVRLSHDTAFLHSIGAPNEAMTAEGFLFPDTYRFYLMMTPKELLVRMLARFKEVINDSMLAEGALEELSPYEVLTLASIIEAEAKRSDERDTIAGVYLNRIQMGMKLDADPTVQYGLGLTRPITHDDLLKDNPYNTYLNEGLPPGPINNPGKAAILAALHPAHHNKIYFVARRDGSGGHYFSRTAAEQERAIKASNRNEAE